MKKMINSIIKIGRGTTLKEALFFPFENVHILPGESIPFPEYLNSGGITIFFRTRLNYLDSIYIPLERYGTVFRRKLSGTGELYVRVGEYIELMPDSGLDAVITGYEAMIK